MIAAPKRMGLDEAQIRTFAEQGYLLLPSWLDAPTIAAVRREVLAEMRRETPARVGEQDGETVRAVHGCHLSNRLLGRLPRLGSLVEPARQLLGGEVYLYQFKANTKAAFVGDHWEWHQDFVFWYYEDLLPEPRVLSVALFLDEVNEFNGPLVVIPGSHKKGMIDTGAGQGPAAGAGDADWLSGFTVGLKYGLPRGTVRELVAEGGMVAPKGPAGSLLLFDANLVHGSGMNLSPYDRYLCLLTYSAAGNLPRRREGRRPEFLVSRDFTPVEPLPPGEALLPDG